MFVCEKPSRWHCRVYGFCSFGDRGFLFFERSWFYGCGLVVQITGRIQNKWKVDKVPCDISGNEYRKEASEAG